MPVKTVVNLQRRLAQTGEIRIGMSVEIPGKRNRRPVKSDTILMSTYDKLIATLVAEHYNAPAPELWTPQGTNAPKWLVKTGLTEIDIMVPPVDGVFSQFYEHWTGGECDRRCDGAVMTHPASQRGRACVCGEDGQRDKDPRFCKLTTRVSFMLPWLRSAGTWLLVTHGWNAGTELPGMVDLMQSAQAYQLGRLRLVPNGDKKDGQTRSWYEPKLDLHPEGGPTAAELTGAVPLALAAPAAPALAASPEVIEAEFDELPEPEVAPSAPAPKISTPAIPSAATDEKTTTWTACIQAANARGLTAMSDVLREFRKNSEGRSPSEATVEDFQRFLGHLTGAAT